QLPSDPRHQPLLGSAGERAVDPPAVGGVVGQAVEQWRVADDPGVEADHAVLPAPRVQRDQVGDPNLRLVVLLKGAGERPRDGAVAPAGFGHGDQHPSRATHLTTLPLGRRPAGREGLPWRRRRPVRLDIAATIASVHPRGGRSSEPGSGYPTRCGSTPVFSPTWAMISRAWSMCASVCVAIQLVRSSARPGSTAGATAGLVNRPASNSRRQTTASRMSSPMMIGTIWVQLVPRSNPSASNPLRQRSTLRQRRSRRSGSRSIISSAASAAPALAGGIAALKTIERPWCLM